MLPYFKINKIKDNLEQNVLVFSESDKEKYVLEKDRDFLISVKVDDVEIDLEEEIRLQAHHHKGKTSFQAQTESLLDFGEVITESIDGDSIKFSVLFNENDELPEKIREIIDKTESKPANIYFRDIPEFVYTNDGLERFITDKVKNNLF